MNAPRLLSKEEAIALYKTNFWENMNDSERAVFQAHQEFLCMPFEVFHKAAEKHLGRPVFTHEFGNIKTYEEIKGNLSFDSSEVFKILDNKPVLTINLSGIPKTH